MFGKPEWFKPKSFGWGLTPITWQGWIYTAVWVAVLCVPFVLLLERDQTAEAVTWMSLTMVALIWDVRNILRAMPKKREARVAQAAGEENPRSI